MRKRNSSPSHTHSRFTTRSSPGTPRASSSRCGSTRCASLTRFAPLSTTCPGSLTSLYSKSPSWSDRTCTTRSQQHPCVWLSHSAFSVSHDPSTGIDPTTLIASTPFRNTMKRTVCIVLSCTSIPPSRLQSCIHEESCRGYEVTQSTSLLSCPSWFWIRYRYFAPSGTWSTTASQRLSPLCFIRTAFDGVSQPSDSQSPQTKRAWPYLTFAYRLNLTFQSLNLSSRDSNEFNTPINS
mmetsp:Transcript_25966/g.68397  ORF Transcript_25966/g.68397 Transcript_25966/m.68397 type:complete len:237 (+) Transcript_25966:157-867(+)